LSTELVSQHGVITMSAWTSIFGAVFLIPISMWELRTAAVHLTGAVAVIVLYLAIAVTVAGMWLWLHSLRVLPARIAAGFQYFQPLIGVGASALLFADKLGLIFGVGTLHLLVGAVLAALRRRAR
jgi:drug/metabolite transporter (DMT)-like permease